jgi:N-acetyl-anhydromuramyl-L-alanine amidase AmpD
MTRPGAHVRGHNHNSIGICLVGGVDANQKPDNNFTQEQFDSLEDVLMKLVSTYDIHTVMGHRDFPGVSKACPSFDVTAWLSETGDVRQTLAQIIYRNSLQHPED